MRHRPGALAATAALVAGLAACSGAQGILSADSGWVRAMPPGADATAAYFTLRNGTASVVRIERITAPGFAAARLHETAIVDGIMRMRDAAPIELAPGASVSLEPGGLHLMLTGADQTVDAGDRVELTLWADGAAALTLTLPVARENPYG